MMNKAPLRRSATVALALTLSLGLMACGGGITPTVIEVTDVNITLDRNTLSPGETTKAHVVVRGNVVEQLPNQAVTWTSSDKTVATVDENGLITAKAVGKATIRAASAVPGFTNIFSETTITVVAAETAYPTARFSFRPVKTAGPVPTGYTADNGLPYNTTRGYGWVTQDTARSVTPTPIDASKNTRDRRTDLGATTAVEERQYTLIHLQCGNICKLPHITENVAWEYRVEPGKYNVTVGVGDANQSTQDSGPSQHTVNVEGVTLIDKFSATRANPFREATTANAVPVTDGLLTVDAIGGTNTKINYIMITRVE
ncbi:hypothetical protein DAERI_040233 [Deinococcus aerius]|uniref:BIG2 domain-containing protein n=1 Tax=Deinococcus aerius TaxID=200253 RepID=A0A2I9CUE3_9DEIO|nr:Ig-like domain-containing protein [Deinococcus aerius]GBF05473.1 hypothetical protein DAERI_040233 [Deinococcus aerius]